MSHAGRKEEKKDFLLHGSFIRVENLSQRLPPADISLDRTNSTWLSHGRTEWPWLAQTNWTHSLSPVGLSQFKTYFLLHEVRVLSVRKMGRWLLGGQPTVFIIFFSSLSDVIFRILPTKNLLMSSKSVSSFNFSWVPDTSSSAHCTSAPGCPASSSNYVSKMVLIIFHPRTPYFHQKYWLRHHHSPTLQ